MDRLTPPPTTRLQFFKGREAIKAFLQRKWAKELDYALMKVRSGIT